VELSTDEAEEFLILMQGARESVASTKLSDDELVGVAGGVEQVLDDVGEIIDVTRYLACKAAPFIAGYPYIIKKYESRNGGF
jgi:phosphoserine phosphatase